MRVRLRGVGRAARPALLGRGDARRAAPQRTVAGRVGRRRGERRGRRRPRPAQEDGARVEVEVELALADAPRAVESVSASGTSGYVWTRKRAGIPARGWVAVDGRRRAVDSEAVIDETAGYHSRHTLWRWSAGVGLAADGARVAWNLVEGVNDDRAGSERTLWLDGEPSEVAPVTFSPGLAAVRFEDGGELRFAPWAELAHRTRLGIVGSDYRQPLGSFTGELSGGSSSPRAMASWSDTRRGGERRAGALAGVDRGLGGGRVRVTRGSCPSPTPRLARPPHPPPRAARARRRSSRAPPGPRRCARRARGRGRRALPGCARA